MSLRKSPPKNVSPQPTSTEETKETSPEPKAASPGFKFEAKEAAKEAPVFGGFGSSTTSEKPTFSFGEL